MQVHVSINCLITNHPATCVIVYSSESAVFSMPHHLLHPKSQGETHEEESWGAVQTAAAAGENQTDSTIHLQ